MGWSDAEVVRRQLKRRAENFHRVVVRCSKGFPVVIESYPEKEGKPFPTLHWLTCPHLRKVVSRLEEKGWISKIEDLVRRDEIFRRRLKRAHETVKEMREKLIGNPWIAEKLRHVGSGGIRDYTKVKCLHLHLADFLAGVDNPVGEMVWGMIDEKECSEVPPECRMVFD